LALTGVLGIGEGHLFHHRKARRLVSGDFAKSGSLFQDFPRNGGVADSKTKRVVDLMGLDLVAINACENVSKDYSAIMQVLDYVSGMTDNYAMHLARQFSGMGGERI
ncbi:hypothetical protein ACNPOL_26870, partial [Pseudomonas shirazica]